MNAQYQRIAGVVQSGYQVASGMSDRSPYPAGTIAMQTPIFKALGLDLTPFFPGTLNVSIAPYQFQLFIPEYTFKDVHWAEEFPTEDFSFSPCRLYFQQNRYDSLIYYPHPETKIGHFQDASVVEVLAPYIVGIQYGDRVDLEVNTHQIQFSQN
jgi:CTP-dependent riboflavin kinase